MRTNFDLPEGKTLAIYGQHDEGTVDQIKNCLAKGGVQGVLCADGHKGYAQPVGGVIAYRNQVSVSGVGFDIACGNLAIKTDAKYSDIKDDMEGIMNEIIKRISFGIGQVNQTTVEHALFESDTWKLVEVAPLKKMAAEQLGTVGSGNHYVDIFEDEEGIVWVGVHFGSRGLGHKTATKFLELAGGKDGIDVDPTVLDVNSTLGQAYLLCMELAGQYAYAGREWVARTVVRDILQAQIVEEVHNHHNFAWEEEHYGELLWVVRKGATPAFPGQKGFVGGSMGDNAVIIEGAPASKEAELSLFSTVHGAGRVMSRTAAKGKYIKDERGRKLRQQGLVRHDEMMKWIHDKGVVLRGADLDEAPQAYRRLDEVLSHHADTIKILHTLRPVGVAMAGKDIKDPYQD